MSGTETALRLLVLGMVYGDDPADQELIRAFGDFRSPLATAVLREVVHRANMKGQRYAEATTALKALKRIGTDEADSFLYDIAGERVAFLPVYRKELRKLAIEVLTDTENPGDNEA